MKMSDSSLLSLGKKSVQVAASILIGIARSPAELLNVPAWLWSLVSTASPLSTHHPWIPLSATRSLEARLTNSMEAFEFGGGGSTLWLAERVRVLTTVEHQPHWHAAIQRELADSQVNNCNLLLCAPQFDAPSDGGDAKRSRYESREAPGDFAAYVTSIDSAADETLDLVFVDGRCRVACVERSMSKLKPGGILVLDDSDREWYRPAFELLADWPHEDFRGFRKFARRLSQTSIWVKPDQLN